MFWVEFRATDGGANEQVWVKEKNMIGCYKTLGAYLKGKKRKPTIKKTAGYIETQTARFSTNN